MGVLTRLLSHSWIPSVETRRLQRRVKSCRLGRLCAAKAVAPAATTTHLHWSYTTHPARFPWTTSKPADSLLRTRCYMANGLRRLTTCDNSYIGPHRGAADVRAMNAEQVSPSGPHRPPLPPESDKDTAAVAGSSKPHPPPSQRGSKSRRHSLPFAFPPLFSQPANSSSTSLVPAEGRPIPLDDGTAAHRISTLRELNSNYPSPVNRHRYTKSTGAQSST